MPRKPKPEAPPPEADLSRKIREAEFKNILQKLKDGKTLTARESKIAAEFAQERDGKPRKLTQQEVADAWGMSQMNVSKMVRQGMPLDSMEAAIEWRKKFLEERGRGDDAPQSYQEARTRKALLECEKLDIQLAILRDEYIRKVEVREAGIRIGAMLSAKGDALVNDSAGALAGLDEANVTKKLRPRVQIMMAEIRNELEKV